jgi:NTP pyrophosphatase (non-canonical NTP hydrolase)
MDDKVKEILLITQEECAEVTQAISKVFRFGFDDCWPRGEDWVPTNKERLEEEVGDLLCMIDIMVENGIISDENLNKARIRKREKLKTWSSIFK